MLLLSGLEGGFIDVEEDVVCVCGFVVVSLGLCILCVDIVLLVVLFWFVLL